MASRPRNIFSRQRSIDEPLDLTKPLDLSRKVQSTNGISRTDNRSHDGIRQQPADLRIPRHSLTTSTKLAQIGAPQLPQQTGRAYVQHPGHLSASRGRVFTASGPLGARAPKAGSHDQRQLVRVMQHPQAEDTHFSAMQAQASAATRAPINRVVEMGSLPKASQVLASAPHANIQPPTREFIVAGQPKVQQRKQPTSLNAQRNQRRQASQLVYPAPQDDLQGRVSYNQRRTNSVSVEQEIFRRYAALPTHSAGHPNFPMSSSNNAPRNPYSPTPASSQQKYESQRQHLFQRRQSASIPCETTPTMEQNYNASAKLQEVGLRAVIMNGEKQTASEDLRYKNDAQVRRQQQEPFRHPREQLFNYLNRPVKSLDSEDTNGDQLYSIIRGLHDTVYSRVVPRKNVMDSPERGLETLSALNAQRCATNVSAVRSNEMKGQHYRQDFITPPVPGITKQMLRPPDVRRRFPPGRLYNTVPKPVKTVADPKISLERTNPTFRHPVRMPQPCDTQRQTVAERRTGSARRAQSPGTFHIKKKLASLPVRDRLVLARMSEDDRQKYLMATQGTEPDYTKTSLVTQGNILIPPANSLTKREPALNMENHVDRSPLHNAKIPHPPHPLMKVERGNGVNNLKFSGRAVPSGKNVNQDVVDLLQPDQSNIDVRPTSPTYSSLAKKLLSSSQQWFTQRLDPEKIHPAETRGTGPNDCTKLIIAKQAQAQKASDQGKVALTIRRPSIAAENPMKVTSSIHRAPPSHHIASYLPHVSDAADTRAPLDFEQNSVDRSRMFTKRKLGESPPSESPAKKVIVEDGNAGGVRKSPGKNLSQPDAENYDRKDNNLMQTDATKLGKKEQALRRAIIRLNDPLKNASAVRPLDLSQETFSILENAKMTKAAPPPPLKELAAASTTKTGVTAKTNTTTIGTTPGSKATRGRRRRRRGLNAFIPRKATKQRSKNGSIGTTGRKRGRPRIHPISTTESESLAMNHSAKFQDFVPTILRSRTRNAGSGYPRNYRMMNDARNSRYELEIEKERAKILQRRRLRESSGKPGGPGDDHGDVEDKNKADNQNDVSTPPPVKRKRGRPRKRKPGNICASAEMTSELKPSVEVPAPQEHRNRRRRSSDSLRVVLDENASNHIKMTFFTVRTEQPPGNLQKPTEESEETTKKRKNPHEELRQSSIERSTLSTIKTPRRRGRPPKRKRRMVIKAENALTDEKKRIHCNDEVFMQAPNDHVADPEMTSPEGVPVLRPDPPRELKKLIINKNLGETALHRAATFGNMEIASYCVDFRLTDVNAPDNAGYTALHESCVYGHLDVAGYLLSHGADINACAADGTRPIHDAVDHNRVEIARLLLAYGADPLLTTYSDVKTTALSLAKSSEMKTLLFGYLRDLNGERTKLEGAPTTTLDYQWTFNGSCPLFDKFPCSETNIFADVPEPEPIPFKTGSYPHEEIDGIFFEISEKVMLPSFNIRPDDSDRFSNWVLLPDVCKRLSISRDELLSAHPDLRVATLPADQFIQHLEESQVLRGTHWDITANVKSTSASITTTTTNTNTNTTTTNTNTNNNNNNNNNSNNSSSSNKNNNKNNTSSSPSVTTTTTAASSSSSTDPLSSPVDGVTHDPKSDQTAEVTLLELDDSVRDLLEVQTEFI